MKVVIAIDTSLSSVLPVPGAGLGGPNRLTVFRRAVEEIKARLPIGTAIFYLATTPTPHRVTAERLGKVVPEGVTRLTTALAAAVELAPDRIVLVTDGVLALGEEAAVIEANAHALHARHVRVDVVVLDRIEVAPCVIALAHETGGEVVVVGAGRRRELNRVLGLFGAGKED
jgi:nucleotide-binding universal stress UspA family protein